MAAKKSEGAGSRQTRKSAEASAKPIAEGEAKGRGRGSAAAGAKEAGAGAKATGAAGRGKTAAGGAGAGTRTRKTGDGQAPRRGTKSVSGLQAELRNFIDEHSHGWGHNEWTGLLARLREQGHDTSDSDRLGMELEKQRLVRRLEGIAGLGATRVKKLAERFQTLWSLRHASVDEIASVSGVTRPVAEKVRAEIH